MRMVLLAAIAAVVFEVFVLVFIASAERTAVRSLPKWVWFVLCVFFPVIGGIAYLLLGRPMAGEPGFSGADGRPARGSKQSKPRSGFSVFLMNFFGIEESGSEQPNLRPEFKYRPEPTTRKGPIAPDDDPEFLRELDRKLKNQPKDSGEAQPPTKNDSTPNQSNGDSGDETKNESGDN